MGVARGIGQSFVLRRSPSGGSKLGQRNFERYQKSAATVRGHYAAFKGAIGQLHMAFTNVWAGRGVGESVIAPGYFDTAKTEALGNDPDHAKAILECIPAGRLGTLDDFKGLAIFLGV